jgi:GH24 family phage-related lysozyme (muramidase)
MYKDSEGIETIGWGFNLRDRAMPKDLLDDLLRRDVEQAARDLDRLAPWWRQLDPVRAAALHDMSYNLGYTRLAKFAPTLAEMQAGRWAVVGQRLRRTAWYQQTARRGKRIVQMFETGQAPTDLR